MPRVHVPRRRRAPKDTMPRSSRSRLNRLGSRLTQRQSQPEDLGTFIERIACADFECFELFSAFARAMAHQPNDGTGQMQAFDRFMDRVKVVLESNPSLAHA
ncbi:MAG: hypothetical protein IT439_04310 [Phycisphaerales bacterium]|nr:hypothetical protein [Phycisphaerales bacterium]